MALKDTIAALLGRPPKRTIEDGLREGETMMVQRRNGRLVFRKVEVYTERGAEVLTQKRRRRVKGAADFGAFRIVRLPRPEDFMFKVSSGK